eukprot:jgi/Botrbrau1/18520/Bobra.0072s0095.1
MGAFPAQTAKKGPSGGWAALLLAPGRESPPQLRSGLPAALGAGDDHACGGIGHGDGKENVLRTELAKAGPLGGMPSGRGAPGTAKGSDTFLTELKLALGHRFAEMQKLLVQFKENRDRGTLLKGVLRLLSETGNEELLLDFTPFLPKADQEWFSDAARAAILEKQHREEQRKLVALPAGEVGQTKQPSEPNTSKLQAQGSAGSKGWPSHSRLPLGTLKIEGHVTKPAHTAVGGAQAPDQSKWRQVSERPGGPANHLYQTAAAARVPPQAQAGNHRVTLAGKAGLLEDSAQRSAAGARAGPVPLGTAVRPPGAWHRPQGFQGASSGAGGLAAIVQRKPAGAHGSGAQFQPSLASSGLPALATLGPLGAAVSNGGGPAAGLPSEGWNDPSVRKVTVGKHAQRLSGVADKRLP